MMKIVVTGGHLTPALAVIEELKRRHWEIVYIGRKYALEGDLTLAQEWLQVKKLGYKFLPITTGRWQRKFTRYSISSLLKIPWGIVQSLNFLITEKPQVILSFGGYVAVPVVICGWFLGIPVVTHEQTLSVGLANKIVSRFSQKICLGWVSLRTNFPKIKVVFTGNPIRQEIFTIKQTLTLQRKKPLIYITGGNLGAHSLNTLIESILIELLDSYEVIHQCGETQQYQDYQTLTKLRNNLPLKIRQRYHLIKYVDQELIGFVLQSAEIVVTRAGANIVTEIIALKKPALFIPLPWAGGNEQLLNAQILTDIKAAEMIIQDQLKGKILLQKLQKLWQNREIYRQKLSPLNKMLVYDAAKKIVNVVESRV